MQIVSTLCDLCFHSGQNVESAGTNRIEVNGKAIEIDLCDSHQQTTKEMLSIFFDLGRRPDTLVIRPKAPAVKRNAPEPGHYECGFCEYTSTSPQGIGMHKAKAHGWVSPNRKAEKARGDASPSKGTFQAREGRPPLIEGESPRDRKNRLDRDRKARKRRELAGGTA